MLWRGLHVAVGVLDARLQAEAALTVTLAGGCCVITSCVAAAGVTAMALVTPRRGRRRRRKAYSRTAALVSDSPENVATPLEAVTESVPPRVALPGLLASATVTVPSNEVIEIARAVLGLDRQAESGARGDAGRRLLGHHQLDRGQGGDADRVGPGSVNQRLPSGPVVIHRVGTGRDGVLGDGVGRRVDLTDLAGAHR